LFPPRLFLSWLLGPAIFEALSSAFNHVLAKSELETGDYANPKATQKVAYAFSSFLTYFRDEFVILIYLLSYTSKRVFYRNN